MTTEIILFNFENILNDEEQAAIEKIIGAQINDTYNIPPIPPNDAFPSSDETQAYILKTIAQVLHMDNGWVNPTFIIRPANDFPLFSMMFLAALEAASGQWPAVLDLKYTNTFPHVIDPEASQLISLHAVRAEAYQIRYYKID